MLFLVGTFGMNFPISISTMAVNVFHTDVRGFGLLSSIMAIGTIAEALLAGASHSRCGSLLAGACVFGIGCTLGAIAPGYWWFARAPVIVGVVALTLTNNTNSMMQLTTEPAMRRRVMVFRVAVELGGTPIGAPIVGWVAKPLRSTLGARSGSGIRLLRCYCGALRHGPADCSCRKTSSWKTYSRHKTERAAGEARHIWAAQRLCLPVTLGFVEYNGAVW
jgi:MFS family permease